MGRVSYRVLLRSRYQGVKWEARLTTWSCTTPSYVILGAPHQPHIKIRTSNNAYNVLQIPHTSRNYFEGLVPTHSVTCTSQTLQLHAGELHRSVDWAVVKCICLRKKGPPVWTKKLPKTKKSSMKCTHTSHTIIKANRQSGTINNTYSRSNDGNPR